MRLHYRFSDSAFNNNDLISWILPSKQKSYFWSHANEKEITPTTSHFLNSPFLLLSQEEQTLLKKEFRTRNFTQNTEGRSCLLVSISGELYCFSFQVFELKGPQNEVTILLLLCITRNYHFHSLQNSTEKSAFLIIFQFVCRHVTRWCTYLTARLKGFYN